MKRPGEKDVRVTRDGAGLLRGTADSSSGGELINLRSERAGAPEKCYADPRIGGVSEEA